jgi:hypothetical protein
MKILYVLFSFIACLRSFASPGEKRNFSNPICRGTGELFDVDDIINYSVPETKNDDSVFNLLSEDFDKVGDSEESVPSVSLESPSASVNLYSNEHQVCNEREVDFLLAQLQLMRTYLFNTGKYLWTLFLADPLDGVWLRASIFKAWPNLRKLEAVNFLINDLNAVVGFPVGICEDPRISFRKLEARFSALVLQSSE